MRATEDPGGDFNIPAMYKVPFVEIKQEELTSDDLRRVRQQGPQYGTTLSNSRPRKLLFVVSFKCSRVLVFYLLEGTGLQIREGDIVIVEADRGQDLGTVQHANVTPDQARLYLRKYAEEQYKWLMMFSVNNAPSNINPNAQLAPPTMQGMPRENLNNLKPKAIKRLANAHEIKMLAEKEGNEAKAKRTCQQKVAHLHLQMEILDAEWQWDFQKLIFYYYADHYINFKDLITELYRIYKTRIWLSAVNPASFSQHAMGQPPSGIGPGAITPNNGNMNTSYTMAYGADPDPYGAVPPYRVAYDAYDPNYPSIPGVTNSFAPVAGGNNFTPTAATFQPATDVSSVAPTMQPGSMATGSTSDYSYYYERAGNNEQRHSMMMAPASTMMPPTSTQQQQQQQQQQHPYLPTTMATPLPQQNAYWTNEYPTYPKYTPDPYAHIKDHVYPSPPWKQAPWKPSPWNSSNSPINPAAAGLGRQAEIPLPIGTRPKSNGSQITKSEPPEEYMRQLRACQEAAVREHQQQQQQQQQGLSSRYMIPPAWAATNQQEQPSTGQQQTSRRAVTSMASWRPSSEFAGPPPPSNNNASTQSSEGGASRAPPSSSTGYADEMSRER
ncbi:hypothetical protein B0A55_06594 [Friedmanniomyces simplex]|uniref:PSP1 C-terminal domain-containing protein n=1 Tax=Friedmanniomyces simplex TaxID=329884 RepID=A0A4U0XLF8_9PEZI|nr:hypothetical protein B0A55_06594 [Friedmanniomyces simplex]